MAPRPEPELTPTLAVRGDRAGADERGPETVEARLFHFPVTPAPPPAVRRGPVALRALISGVIALGGVVLLAAAVDVYRGPRPALWRLGLGLVLAFLGDLAVLHIRFGHDRHSFTWSEGLVVVGLVLLPSPWLRLVALPGVALGHAVRRRQPIKIAFNTACSLSGLFLAGGVFHLVGRRLGFDASQPGTWLALGAGSLTWFVWNGVTVSTAVAFSQGKRWRTVYLRGFGLNGLVWLGNTVAAVAVVSVASWEAKVLLVLPVFVGALYLAYQAYLRAMQESETWKVLQTASRELIRPRVADVAPVVLAEAGSLFEAEFVELMVADGEPGTQGLMFRSRNGVLDHPLEGDPMDLAGSFWPRAFSERELFEVRASRAPAAQRDALESLGLAQAWIAPLVTSQGCLGTLRIGFRGEVRMRPRELQVLSTFANHVSASVSNALLFEDMVEEKAKLSGILDNSSDGILSVDPSGQVTSWNPAMEQITGTPAALALGRPLFAGLQASTEDGVDITTEWVKARAEESDQFQSLVRFNRSGATKWINLSAAGVRTLLGDLDAVVVVVHDVTATREADEAKQDFLATVSHELRTPLTSLKGFLMTLLRPDYRPGPDDLVYFHERMLRQSVRLERLIEDLLSVSRLERGEFAIDAKPVDISELVDKVIADFLTQSPKRQIEVAVDRATPQVLVDSGRVEQVIHNLLSNADRYTPPEGQIAVTVKPQGDMVLVAVTDEGPGIPEDKQEVIFERFHRLGHHLTREQGGTGLGLYIARVLVDAMGGRIWVESTHGQGASFSFTLPAARTSV